LTKSARQKCRRRRIFPSCTRRGAKRMQVSELATHTHLCARDSEKMSREVCLRSPLACAVSAISGPRRATYQPALGHYSCVLSARCAVCECACLSRALPRRIKTASCSFLGKKNYLLYKYKCQRHKWQRVSLVLVLRLLPPRESIHIHALLSWQKIK
jgi:hypothetical protein